MIKTVHYPLCRRESSFFRLLFLFVLGAVLATLAAGGISPVLGEEANPITACFEGPGTKAAGKGGGKDEFSRSMAEAKAGPVCEPVAKKVIQKCLTRIDQSDNDTKDYYGCIGIAANPCIDSAWAASEFRRVVCTATEERSWLDIIHGSLNKLKARLDGSLKTRLEAMEKNFFAYRDKKCGLRRTLREGREPDLAYGACTAETAARLAIDLREMLQDAEKRDAGSNGNRDAKKLEGSGKSLDQSTANGKTRGSGEQGRAGARR